MSEVNKRLEGIRKGLSWVEFVFPKKMLKLYADLRVGATAMEKRAYHADGSVMLTFDDYGSPKQIKQILKILSDNDVLAMFFVQGDWAEQAPELVEMISDAGHMIGNHTYSHPDLKSLTDNEVREEIRRGPKSKWLRPPRGRFDDRIRKIATGMGYVICYWDTDSDDWQGISREQIISNVVPAVKHGSVVLFHMHADNTIAALPDVIAGIRERGLEVMS